MYCTDNLGIHLEEPQPNIPVAKPSIDYSHEASEYEKKLIQVCIYGELIMVEIKLQSKEKDSSLLLYRERKVWVILTSQKRSMGM